ncbi:DUF4340 domain-containing protein [Candidatus Binatia bacterium]|jgi:hypothetical protein|nr:DUF4340 domain-containing protein [Candidatus Binatia bacterium]
MSPLRRSLLSLAVIALSLAAAWVAWRLEPPPPPPPGAAAKPVLELPASDVRALSITSWQGVLRAHRAAAGWQVDEIRLGPGTSPAEPGTPPPSQQEVDQALDGLVREIVGMAEIDRFSPDGKPMSDFGLDPPQATIELALATGERRTLEIGELTVTTSALYARVIPGDDVFQIGSLVFNDVAAALFRLRALAVVPPGGDA